MSADSPHHQTEKAMKQKKNVKMQSFISSKVTSDFKRGDFLRQENRSKAPEGKPLMADVKGAKFAKQSHEKFQKISFAQDDSNQLSF